LKPGTKAHGLLVLLENRLHDCERGANEAEAFAQHASSPEVANRLLTDAKVLRAEANDLRQAIASVKTAAVDAGD
jgi:hypothetical protein